MKNFKIIAAAMTLGLMLAAAVFAAFQLTTNAVAQTKAAACCSDESCCAGGACQMNGSCCRGVMSHQNKKSEAVTAQVAASGVKVEDATAAAKPATATVSCHGQMTAKGTQKAGADCSGSGGASCCHAGAACCTSRKTTSKS